MTQLKALTVHRGKSSSAHCLRARPFTCRVVDLCGFQPDRDNEKLLNIKGSETISMPDTEAKKKWMQDNFLTLGLKLHRKYDADIIDFLLARESGEASKQDILKEAMREYMKNHHNH